LRFFTNAENRIWADTYGFPVDDDKAAGFVPTCDLAVRIEAPESFSRLHWFARGLEEALRPREDLLIWVTNWGIYPSSENGHLYYRHRLSYGDQRLLSEAPGHLCLEHEQRDAGTWIQLFTAFAWDFYLLPARGFGRGFVSHDGYAVLESSEPEDMERMCESMRRGKFEISRLNRDSL
jgi:hypothetical protein